MIRFVAACLLAAACLATVAVRADESTEQVRARLAAAQKKLDHLRDNSTANDYRTIQVAVPTGA